MMFLFLIQTWKKKKKWNQSKLSTLYDMIYETTVLLNCLHGLLRSSIFSSEPWYSGIGYPNLVSVDVRGLKVPVADWAESSQCRPPNSGVGLRSPTRYSLFLLTNIISLTMFNQCTFFMTIDKFIITLLHSVLSLETCTFKFKGLFGCKRSE